jgi:hypothetical protein
MKIFDFEKRVLWYFDLSQMPVHNFHPAVDSIHFSFATSDILDELANCDGFAIESSYLDFYPQLVSRRNRLFVGRIEGAIVFSGGIMVGTRGLNKGYFRLEKDEFFIVACFTHPQYRGRGIYPRALSHICGMLATEGYHVGYVDIVNRNRASMHGARKAGAIDTGSHYYQLRVLNRFYVIPRGPLSNRFH